MNKKNLLKTILITLLIFIGLTWVIKTGTYSDAGEFSEGALNPYGIFDFFQIPLKTFQTFAQYGVYLLVVGGFYGVLKRCGAYDKIISILTSKNKKMFLILTVILFTILSSVLGISMSLFVLVPFFKDVLENMGYDKKNAMLATIGSIFIGIIGSTVSFDVNGYVKYFYEVDYSSLIIVKLALLIILPIILILFVLKKEKKLVSKEIKCKDVKILPAIFISIIVILIGFMGMYSWYYAHNISIFDDLHSAIGDFKVGSFSLVSSLIGRGVSALGRWSEVELSVILLIGSYVISWIYGLKFNEFYDGFKDGVKEMFPSCIFVTLSFVIFITLYTSSDLQSIFYTIADKIINLSEKVSIIPMTLLSCVGTIFYGQFIYLASDLSAPLMAAYADGYAFMTLIMQAIYGLTLFVGPTSMLLLGGLSYFDISFKDWFKYIIKFVLILLGILMVTFLIVSWVL